MPQRLDVTAPAATDRAIPATDAQVDTVVSVILPTYNRAGFLERALASIAAQRWIHWELIVVDDGSTDETSRLVRELTAGWAQPVRYVYQQNSGAYVARNTGVEHARGSCVAFFDSDDLWLPHHLSNCVAVLEANADLDWVYGARRIVAMDNGRVLAPSEFYEEGRPRAFLSLQTRHAGPVRILEDPLVLQCAIDKGLWCGLQNSVIRRRVFDSLRFDPASRNGGDRFFSIRAVKRGFTLGYLDDVHVLYQVHEDNSSLTGAQTRDFEHRYAVRKRIVEGYERLLDDEDWRPAERRAIRRRLHGECFWILGYGTLWQAGRRAEARAMFRRGLRHWPWDWRSWKTYLLALIKTARPVVSEQ